MTPRSRVLDDSRPIRRGLARLKAGGRRRFVHRPMVEALEGRALLSVAGSPDFTYGTQGMATVSFSNQSDVRSSGADGGAMQSNGKVVEVGSLSLNLSFDPQIAVTRFNTDSSVDTTFGTQGAVILPAPAGADTGVAVAIQSNGQIVVVANIGASISEPDNVPEIAVYRLNSDGSIDTTFGTGGSVLFQFKQGTTALPSVATTVAIAPDGDIVVGGYGITQTTTSYVPALAAFTTSGTPDTTFGTSGQALLTFNGVSTPITTNNISVGVAGLAIQASGAIDFETTVMPTSDNGYQIAVGQLTSSGAFDPTFGTGGQVILSGSSADFAGPLAILSNGQLIVTGGFWAPLDVLTDYPITHYDVYRLNPDGTIDTSFGTNGEATPGADSPSSDDDESISNAVLIEPDGTILLGGDYAYDGSVPNLVALNSDGSTDLSFGMGGQIFLFKAADSIGTPINGLALQSDGKILVTTETGVTRLLATGAANDFDEDGTSDAAILLQDYDAPVFAYLPSTGATKVFEAFGIPGAGQTLPAQGAYDGQGIDELAAYFPSSGAFGIRPYGTTGAKDEIDFIGLAGAGNSLPAPADYNGAAYTELGVYEPSIGAFVYSTDIPSDMYFNYGSSNDVTIPFGTPGTGNSIPAPADYTGAGVDELGVYLPALGAFAYRPAGTTGADDVIIPFGTAGADNAIPVPGDYDGSGHTELAVYLPLLGAFAYRPYGTTGASDVVIPFGTAGLGNSIPMPGDYDGSGHTELAVYLPSLGVLAYRPYNGGADQYIPFGTPGAANSVAFTTVVSDNPGSGGDGGKAFRPAAVAGWVDFVPDLASQAKKKGDSGSSGSSARG